MRNKAKHRNIHILLIMAAMIFLYPAAVLAGDVILSWVPPQTNSDGSPLTDLAGYNVYYGATPGSYSDNIDVGNVTTYQVGNLTEGLTYYFTVTAYDTSGNESALSEEVSVTIATTPLPEPEITVTDSAAPADDLHILFGILEVSSSSDQTVTVTNNGDADLVIGSIALANPLTDPFSIIDDNCTQQSIQPSATCTLTVRFLPLSTGTFNDGFDIPSNDSDENPVTITLNGSANSKPVADTGGPYTGIEGQAISLDGSASTDSGGNIVLYEWDVDNDGIYEYSSSLPAQSHTYTQQGRYTVKLKLTDNLGATDEAITTANISDTLPDADFTGSPTNGTAPLTVIFTNKSSGYDQPLIYEWDFDNNGIIDSTAKNPSYTYTTEGRYTIKLSVTDSDGSSNALLKTDYITLTTPLYRLAVSINGSGTVTSSLLGINCPVDCSEQYGAGDIVTLTATPQNGYVLDSWIGCDNVPGSNQCIVTMNADAVVTATFRTGETMLSCPDAGDIECLERTDGGTDSDNLDNGKPRVDMEYEFRITLQDRSGNTLEYIKLYMTQRSNPDPSAFYAYDMHCSGDLFIGGLCVYATTLGPAATHKFYFMAKMSDGTILRYPDSGYINGPVVQLLTGLNLVGIPRDFGSGLTSGSIKTGRGYFLYRQRSETLPEFAEYRDMIETEFTYKLDPGWNFISNPYAGEVRLSDITVRRGNNLPQTWEGASSDGWLANGLYYYNGSDWGGTIGFETGPDTRLIPWRGYGVYLKASDDIYYIVIPRP